MDPGFRPQQIDSAVSRTIQDDVVVLDLDQDEPTAHCLNPTAAAVWELCDGTHSLEQIKGLVHRDLALADDIDGVVELAVAELSEAGLLEPIPRDVGLPNRREALAGLAAALVPVVASIVLPTPAAAATGTSCGQHCTGFTGVPGACTTGSCKVWISMTNAFCCTGTGTTRFGMTICLCP